MGQTMLGNSTTVNLVREECCNCGCVFAMTQEMYDRRRNDHKSFYCPNGHAQHYTGESEEEKLKRQLRTQKESTAWYSQQYDRTRVSLEQSRRSKAALKGHLTRARNKLAKGQCPCCDQIFGNVREHMKFKHPDYHLTDPETGAVLDA